MKTPLTRLFPHAFALAAASLLVASCGDDAKSDHRETGHNPDRKSAISGLLDDEDEADSAPAGATLEDDMRAAEQIELIRRMIGLIEKGDLDGMRKCIKDGVELNDHGKDYSSLLKLAARTGNVDCVNLLISSGAKVGAPVVEEAAGQGRVKVLKELLKHRKDKETVSGALFSATKSGKVKCMKLLLDAGADPNYQNKTLSRPVLECVLSIPERDKVLSAATLLLEKGANPDATAGSLSKPMLQTAIERKDYELAGLLLKHGANPNIKDYSKTLLARAVDSLDFQTAELLLKHGADANSQDSIGDMLLETAVRKEVMHRTTEPKMVKLLLEHGANPNQGDIIGTTYLCYSLDHDNLLIAEELLKHGASPDVKEYGASSDYCLYRAVDQDKEEVVKLLCRYGADVFVTGGYKKQTALEIAGQHPRLLPVLRGAALKAAASKQPTPTQQSLIDQIKGFPALCREAWIINALDPEGKVMPRTQNATFVSTDGTPKEWWPAKRSVPNEVWNRAAEGLRYENVFIILNAFPQEVQKLRELNKMPW